MQKQLPSLLLLVGVSMVSASPELADIAAELAVIQAKLALLSGETAPDSYSAPSLAPKTTSSPTMAAEGHAPTSVSPTHAPTSVSPTHAPTTGSPTHAPTTGSPTHAPTSVSPTHAPTTTSASSVWLCLVLFTGVCGGYMVYRYQITWRIVCEWMNRVGESSAQVPPLERFHRLDLFADDSAEFGLSEDEGEHRAAHRVARSAS